jgi:acyl dehydratase
MIASWPDRLRAHRVPDVRSRWDVRDTIRYALGVGAALGETDETLFVFEDGLVALPTMALTLGTPGFWLMEPDLGLDWPQILHGEQSMTLHRPLPAEGDVIGKTWIGPLSDKGAGKPALLHCIRHLYDSENKDLITEMEELWVLRGAGGFGGQNLPLGVGLDAMPDGQPDAVLTLPTARHQAALYRLTGDRNPLHISPDVAAKGGFERPILHGLATMGLIGRALAQMRCGGDAARLTAMKLRFTAPVYPGDEVVTEIWDEDDAVRFRATVPARGVVVADCGSATVIKENM